MELDDDTLYEAFTTATLAAGQFHHREHVRVAFVCLRRTNDLAAGASQFRQSLRRLVTALGAERLYHETLTWAYLILIQERMAAADPPFPTSLDLLAAHPDLLDHEGGALAKHYDVAAITASPVARRSFVLP